MFYHINTLLTLEDIMEQLLEKIGKLVSMEIDNVADVKNLDRELGYMFYIILKDGNMLSLLDSALA